MLFIKTRVAPVLPKLFKHEIYNLMSKYSEQVFANIPVKNAFFTLLHSIQLSGNYLYFLC